MHDHAKQTGRGLRWRTAAVVPVSVLAWVALGTVGGVANAASPNGTAAAASTGNGNGTGTANSNSGGNAASNSNGTANGNALGIEKHADPVVTDTAVVTGTTTVTTTSASSSADHSAGNAGTSGTVTEPQPLSNADQNPGGANNGGNCGAYCSTRDGSPSGNGNGGGKAVGKPCAGCVGKADNKNPKGQAPNGTDHNKGYECDGNHGIGRTNPAHTGCTTTPSGCPTGQTCGGGCPAGQTCGGGCPAGQTCGGGCPAGQTCGGGCPAGQTCGGGCPSGTVDNGNGDCVKPGCVPTKANHHCTEVEGKHHTRKHDTNNPPEVLGEKTVRTPPSTLPFTGSNTGGIFGTGLLALLVGLMLLVVGRRSGSATPLSQLRVATALTAARPLSQRSTVRTAARSWGARQRTDLMLMGWTLGHQAHVLIRRARLRHRPRT